MWRSSANCAASKGLHEKYRPSISSVGTTRLPLIGLEDEFFRRTQLFRYSLRGIPGRALREMILRAGSPGTRSWCTWSGLSTRVLQSQLDAARGIESQESPKRRRSARVSEDRRERLGIYVQPGFARGLAVAQWKRGPNRYSGRQRQGVFQREPLRLRRGQGQFPRRAPQSRRER